MPAIGDAIYGGYFAGWMDTTVGNIIAADNSQTGARYMLIVSPLSLEQTALAYKTSTTAAPATSSTRWNGLVATAAMTGTTYPAANYCNGLSYPSDGGSQWYLPAMDELELVYRNLKPTTQNNYTTANTGSTFPGTSQSPGVNPSSSPAGIAYTTGSPAQTSVVLFQSGGAQELNIAGNYYWVSTEYSATSAWYMGTSGSFAGRQGSNGKTASYWVRPVRRVAANVVGTLTSPTPLVTAALTGQQVDPGTLADVAPILTAALTGTAADPGTLTATTITPTAALAGTSTNPGTMAASTPTATASLAGTSTNLGTLTVVIPAPTASLSGASTLAGTLAAPIPLAAAQINGTSLNPGTLTASPRAPTATITGTSTNPASLTAGVPVLTLVAAGTSEAQVDITVTGQLDPRRWGATLTARAKTGTLNPRRWEGHLI